jgi:hypothetical protein
VRRDLVGGGEGISILEARNWQREWASRVFAWSLRVRVVGTTARQSVCIK